MKQKEANRIAELIALKEKRYQELKNNDTRTASNPLGNQSDLGNLFSEILDLKRQILDANYTYKDGKAIKN